MDINIKKLREGAQLPKFGSDEAAGADLHACLQETIFIDPGRWMLIPTGIVIGLPRGFEAQIRPRSGLALKFGVTVLNAPGTIDSDYTGEAGVILINHGKKPFVVTHGDRIAQVVIKKIEYPEFDWAINELRDTERGAAGLGSTGVS